jgi:NitT/TauT family transport system substrate-binding protein
MIFKTVTRRTTLLSTLLAATAAIGLSMGQASAQQPQIKMMMDWAWQGPQSPFLLAQKKGYFAAESVNIQLDRGFGSARVPTELASGAYQMGFADLPTAIRFMHTNPDAGVIAVAVIFDQSPLAAITSSAGPIRSPKDLEGKKIAAPEADGGRQMFPAFAKATGIDVSKVEWLTVQPQLREPMLARGEADAITGFVTSAIMSLEAVGFGADKQRIFRYRDHGLPFYSGAILTTKKFAAENPAIVRGVVKASMRGFQDAIRNPDESIAALKEREALTDVAIEKRRLQIAINELIVTDTTRRNGLSFVEDARMQRNIDIVKETFNLPGNLKPADVFNASFLPEKAFLSVPAATN